MRELRERWGIPLDLLDQIMGRVAGTCARKAEEESWLVFSAAPGVDSRPLTTTSSGALHGQIVEAFQEQLERFQRDDQSPDAEKRARALSILAKTLESIAAIGMKMETHAGQNSGRENGQSDAFHSGTQPGDAEELDRQLTALIGNLAQDGEDAEPAGSGGNAAEGTPV